MFAINKILVPTDFSENSAHAYNPAQQLASKFNAKIDFIHIVPTLRYFNESISNLGLPFSMEKDIYPKVQEESTARLNSLMDDYIKEENRGEAIVRIAPKPSRAIAEEAERGHYDLILMATHGKHESDLLRGTVTEKVIRYSSIPVLATDKSGIDDIKKILVPTDGSQASLAAMPVAVSLALTFDASLTLYHVLELHGSMTENVEPNPMRSEKDNIYDILFEAMETYFKQSWDKVELRDGEGYDDQLVYTEGASNATIDITTVIEKGVSAHHAIREYAAESADLVVMATHGHSGLSHLFLGSTAEKVTQHLRLPVISVKPDLESKK
ncbi:MAG: universal stress protein [Balneolaceae bacterium]|nr:universal stress protein [Balneolaceae bacterium]